MDLRTTSLADLAPVPPLPLLDRQVRIFRLGHRGYKRVETAGIDMLSFQSTEVLVHLLRTAPPELRHCFNSQQLKILEHRKSIPDLLVVVLLLPSRSSSY